MPCLTGDTLVALGEIEGLGCSGGGGLVKLGKQFKSLEENDEKVLSESFLLEGKQSVADDSKRDARVVLLELVVVTDEDNWGEFGSKNAGYRRVMLRPVGSVLLLPPVDRKQDNFIRINKIITK